MDTWIFLVGLFLMTILSFMVWARVSKRRTENKMADPNAPKSSLAKDGPGPNPVTAPRGSNVRPQGTTGTPPRGPDPQPQTSRQDRQ